MFSAFFVCLSVCSLAANARRKREKRALARLVDNVGNNKTTTTTVSLSLLITQGHPYYY